MNDRILRKAEVLKIANVSASTLHRWEHQGRFPKRVALGPNSSGWKESEVKAWFDGLTAKQETAA